MHKTKIVRPYCFSEPDVSGENYKEMLFYYAMPTILHLPASTNINYDGASLHWLFDV